MKSKILLFIIVLNFSAHTVSAQSSWAYSIWFVLKDKHGKILNKKDYEKKGIKLLSNLLFGEHINYDTLTNSFRFSQHTAVRSSILVFILEEDTTIIEISTKDLYLSEISLTGNTYDIRIWGNEKDFICQMKLREYKNILVCKNKVAYGAYLIEQKDALIKIENLIEVKLE